MNTDNKKSELQMEEKEAMAINGMPVLIVNTALEIIAFLKFVFTLVAIDNRTLGMNGNYTFYYIIVGICAIYAFIIGPILYIGLKVLKPKEAYVLTLFGEYYGTLRGPGFFFVNPFVTAFNPATTETTTGALTAEAAAQIGGAKSGAERSAKIIQTFSKKISLKTMTLNNDRQKINDQLGNPIIIGIVVIWKVVNTAKAVFNVDNYTEYLSIQCDSALRNIVRLYPYDIADGDDSDNEKSLRGSSQEIAEKLKQEIQTKVDIAGLAITEARITSLAYAPEIAAAMLQRQQASAVIAARQMIVDGAVGMVEMALDKLNEKDIVHLDEERKAAMVSNLLVVLCANKEAQPIVNSGSLY